MHLIVLMSCVYLTVFSLAGAGRDKELPYIDMRLVNNNKKDLMLKVHVLQYRCVRLSFVTKSKSAF